MLARYFHTSATLWMRRIRKRNPGVSYQIDELQHEEDFSQDPEGFANIESNFMDVHKTHRQHEEELNQQQEFVRLKMVQRKYFRDAPLPNLLTYAEKEHMRLLHTRDSDEWTIDRLAESFPATPEIVKKVLAANWRPYTVKRIRKHDQAVIENWKKLRNDQTEWAKIPPELQEHLKKFTARKPEDLVSADHRREEWQPRPALPIPSSDEFRSIIDIGRKVNVIPQHRLLTSKTKVDVKEQSDAALPPLTAAEDETYLLSKVLDKRSMRLQELRQRKLSTEDMNVSISKQDASPFLPSENDSPNGTGIIPKSQFSSNSSSCVVDYTNKFASTEIVISANDQRRFEITRTKDHVHIPRKLWRKGATYRVEDCYYDDDGEFLYRVPGMTGGS